MTSPSLPRRRGLLALALTAFLIGGSVGQAASTPPAAWAQANSDLKADPAVTFGVLPNGMRYAVMHNATPPGQVSMRLLIRAGSMQEAKGQEGLAHFLEHMAFRGSTHLADLEVFPMLERLGLARGADSNAGTGREQTVYQFDLPRSDDQTVDAGLMVLREISGELLLKQETMDAERGVVLSEERARDTPALHASKALDKMTFGDHPFGRLPIGERSVIETAPVSRMRAFYEAYYRPERAFLIVVGDIDEKAIAGKITAKFSDWRGKGPPGADPKPLQPTAGEKVRFYTEKGLGPQMVVYWMGRPKDERDTRAYEIERIQEGLAFAVLNKRYADIARQPSPPFLGASAGGSEARRVARLTSLGAIGPTDWREALKALIATQRQALTYGVQQEELDRVIIQNRTGLQNAVATAATRRTPGLVGGLLGAAQSDLVYMSPQQRLDLFEDAVKSLTVDRANTLLRQRFALAGGPLVFVAGPDTTKGDQTSLEAAFAEAKAQPVTALAKVEIKPWPYTDFGAPGTVVSKRRIEDLDITLVSFANGVRLAVKPTDFTKNQIQVRVRVGYGLLDIPNDRMTSINGLGSRIVEGGLVGLTPTEVNRSIEGKVVSVGAGVGDEGFTLAGGTRPQDFDLEMQLLTAYVTKPGWRTDGLPERLQLAKTMYSQADATPGGVFGRNAGLMLHSGDMRWRQPDPDEISAMNPEEVKAFMTPILADGPIDVSIVGDLTVDQAIAAVAKTLGALPPRQTRGEHPQGRAIKFPAATPQPVVLRHHGRADQGLVFVAWPTPGFFDHDAALRLRLLQLIINDRLFDQVRSKEGKTYSPSGDVYSPEAFPGYGYLMVSIEAPPSETAAMLQTIDAVVSDLAAREVSADELERVRKPRIELWRRNLRTNDYWGSLLINVFDSDAVLIAPRTNLEAYPKVTPAELKAVATRYLTPDKAFRIVVAPDQPVTASGTRP
ncbi:MAG TPA: insulinase family protein, partial [Caulobacteraceae bacterium]|nr:insulinase family protein [Caulobacteraceae bacterium]